MADEKDGYRIPILDRENHDSWFRQQRIKLRGKQVFYTCEKKVEEYARVATIGDITKELEELDITDTNTKQTSTIRINIEKKKKYDEDEATALALLFRSLSEDDQALTDEYESVYDFWAYLKKKYAQMDAVTANKYMTKIQTFIFDSEQSTITASWDKLKEYRRKLVNADATVESAYPDRTLLLVLIRALPKSYSSTIDTLNIQSSLSVENKPKFLEEKENRLKEDNELEHANAARMYNKKYVPPQRRPSQSDSDDQQKRTRACYLCSKKHMARDCPYLEIAQDAVKHAMKTLSKSYSRKAGRTNPEKKTPSSTKDEKNTASRKRNHGLAATQTSSTEDSDTEADSSQDLEDADETVLLSNELIRKAQPSTWPADSGASSHMSDQPSLFRKMIPIKRRTIRVGGGLMYADQKGTVDMMCEDGSSMLLADVLYVPGLGVNLLSARRICQSGLKGSFDRDKMFFKLHKEKIIEATMRNGLYIVTHVADGFQDKAFIAIPTIEEDAEMEETVRAVKSQKTDLTSKQESLYKLMHRRFNHLGPEKIRNLHKVTTMSAPIKIPTEREVYEVCALAKMKNRIPKTLSEHKDRKLALIQFDIAGPFAKTVRGNRYFLLIIDNYTRKNWVIALKQKSEAIEGLKTWKRDVEFQTNEKILAARSDNAPELIKAVGDWRDAGAGTRSEQTTAATSHQNGPAERNIGTAEADMRAMLKEADLPLEFWDEAVEHDAYIRNLTDTGPVIDGSIVSPYEAYAGTTPSIDHIKVWGHKAYVYINPKTIPAGQRHDKLRDTARVGVFMGCTNNTTKHFKVYCPELGYTQRFSRVVVDENTKGGTVDLRLRGESGPKGTTNVQPDRLPRGRPKKELPIPDKPQVKTIPQVIIKPFKPPPNVTRFDENDNVIPDVVPEKDIPGSWHEEQTEPESSSTDKVPELNTDETRQTATENMMQDVDNNDNDKPESSSASPLPKTTPKTIF
jgi:hypothetical protein